MAALGTARGCCNGRVTAILLGHQLLSRGGTKLLVAQHTVSSRATALWVAVRSSVSPVQVGLHPWRAMQVSALHPWRVLEALSLTHPPSFLKDHPVEILASKILGLCAKTTWALLSCSRHPGFSLPWLGPRRAGGDLKRLLFQEAQTRASTSTQSRSSGIQGGLVCAGITAGFTTQPYKGGTTG